MPTDYDKISTHYEASIDLPIRIYVEEYSFTKLSPNFKNQKVLDLACGEGRFTRKIKKQGAQQVLGVDKSKKMIATAQRKETANPQGIQYLCADVKNLGKVGNFDIVVAVFLLHYADNKELLESFCKNIFTNLKPGGVFFALNTNVHTPIEKYGTYRKYGLYMSADSNRKEGDPIAIVLKNKDGTFVSMENYYMAPETYENIFKKVGFAEFTWEPVSVSPTGVETMGKDYWEHFLKYSPLTIIRAKKTF